MNKDLLKRVGMLTAATAACTAGVFGALALNGLRYMRPTADNYLRFCGREELHPEAWSPNYDMTVLLRIAGQGYPVKDVPEMWKRKAGSLRDFADIAARYDPRRPDVLLEREARRRARALLESRYPDRRKPSAEDTAPRQSLRAERLSDTLPVRSVKRHSI